MRLDQAMLFVNDLERMTAFYTNVMGFRPIEHTKLNDWIEFDTGGAGFSLHAVPGRLRHASEALAPAPREGEACKLIFSVEDLDAEKARLRAEGVQILSRPWGGWDAVDPEGNVLGFREIPG
jgi:catechol 2,3-dioxygenase-like lactoylglutathione lyase family enzyme